MVAAAGAGSRGSTGVRAERPTRIRLRAWQSEALERFAVHPAPDFLAVATPGAGKTTFALTAAVRHLADTVSLPLYPSLEKDEVDRVLAVAATLA